MNIRIGQGIDYHQLSKERKLWVGGVLITEEFGTIAHSDGDVLLHAICDALLGALSLGDIGIHFPNNDEKYKNISSLKLLELVYKMIINKQYEVVNIDSMVILETPKLKNYIDLMKQNIANILNIEIDCISIKATTKENMDAVGKGDGIEAHAVVLIKKA